MSTPFDLIRMIWRPAPHTPRLVVGSLVRDDAGYWFGYDGADLAKAQEMGFTGYPGMLIGKDYNGQAMSAFASRLISRERTDFARLATGWGSPLDSDDFELLGRTFGRLPTDMFEFIPVIHPERGVCYFTDLAGIQNYAQAEEFRHLPQGSILELEPNPSDPYDELAVMVMHQGHQVAHIKKVHSDSICTAFNQGIQPTCRLVRVQMNGVIKEVVVEIAYN